ncbi:MAG: OmpH family outer membrane protein [Chitinophagales bacterium]|nr:OmpH family outer membrane protein [Chitinophagales bacterium]
MKNLSLILNAILFLLVGVLFFLHFKGNNASTTKSTTVKTVKSDNNQTGQIIAYFDIDSFQENYTYYQVKKKEIEKEQDAINYTIEKEQKSLESLANSYQQKLNTMTEEDYYKAQETMMKKQQALEQKAQNLTEKLVKKTDAFNKELMQSIIDYLKEYNADNKYAYILPFTKESPNLLYTDTNYDITEDIINGMNEQYEKKKK